MRIRPLLIPLVLSAIAGCGASTGQVSGKVTFKSQPVSRGNLVLKSSAQPDLEFFGMVREDGSYQISYRTYNGLPVGKYTVTISRHVLPGGKDLPAGEKGQVLIDAGKTIQQAFTFEKNIVAGNNGIDFELSEGKMQIIPFDKGDS